MALDVWRVLAARTPGEEPQVVGSIKAPDAHMAAIVARETHFRHREAAEGWIERDGERIAISMPVETALDRSYRRNDGYIGVGSRLSRIREQMAEEGRVIQGPRPPRGHTPKGAP